MVSMLLINTTKCPEVKGFPLSFQSTLESQARPRGMCFALRKLDKVTEI